MSWVVCPRCHFEPCVCRGQVPVFNPPIPQEPRGCICPPGANKDCENPTCPRKGPNHA